jgi:hypothetical protein
MMLWLVCLFVTAAQFTQLFWKATLEREIRWGLYQVRDNLRWAGIQNPELLKDSRFWELDDSLTLRCRYLHTLALWPMLVIARRVPRAELESVARQSILDAGPLSPFYEEEARLTMKHLRYRHLILGRLGLRWLAAHFGLASTSTAAEYLVTQTPGALKTHDWTTLRSRVGVAS